VVAIGVVVGVSGIIVLLVGRILLLVRVLLVVVVVTLVHAQRGLVVQRFEQMGGRAVHGIGLQQFLQHIECLGLERRQLIQLIQLIQLAGE